MNSEIIKSLPSYSQQLLYQGAVSNILNPHSVSDSHWAQLGRYVIRPLLRLIYAFAVLLFAGCAVAYHTGCVIVGKCVSKEIDAKAHARAAWAEIAVCAQLWFSGGILHYAFAGSKGVAEVVTFYMSKADKEASRDGSLMNNLLKRAEWDNEWRSD
jgi:hypothetical protein